MNQPEKNTLLIPAVDYLSAIRVAHKHLVTFVRRSIGGRFCNIPVEGNKGWPDLEIYPGNGRVFFVEFKTKAGRVSPEQKAVFAMLAERGYEVHVIREFKAFLKLIRDNLEV